MAEFTFAPLTPASSLHRLAAVFGPFRSTIAARSVLQRHRAPGEARRYRDAQRYLFQLLTGADLRDPRHALAFTSSNDHSRPARVPPGR